MMIVSFSCCRYLNQRFIEDIELLSKEQGSITNINISSKFEHLEETITNLDSRTNSLQKTVNILTEKNLALEQENSSLQDKYFTMETDKLTMQERVQVLETAERTSSEEIRRLKAAEQKLREERKAFEEKTEMAFATREAEHIKLFTALQQSEAEMQIKIQNLEKADAFNQDCQNQLSEKTNSNLTEMNGFLQRIEKKVESNEERSTQNTAGVQRNSEKINKLAELQASITDRIESKSTETWNAIDKIIASHSETVLGVNDMIKINQNNIGTLKDHHEKQIQSVHEILKSTHDKVRLLEEAHQHQLQKNDHYDSFKGQILKLDEERQKAEVRTRDEVDWTANQNNLIINRLNDLEGKTEGNTKSLTEIEPLARSTDQKIAVFKQEIIKETNSHFESIKSEMSTTLLKVVEKKDDFQKYFENMKEETEKEKQKFKNFVDEKFEDSNAKIESLEAADVFLQGTYRKMTEKSTEIETGLVTLEQTFKKENEEIKNEIFNKIKNERTESDKDNEAFAKNIRQMMGKLTGIFKIYLRY